MPRGSRPEVSRADHGAREDHRNHLRLVGVGVENYSGWTKDKYMVELLIGIVGALVGAAGSYFTQRKLEAERRSREALEELWVGVDDLLGQMSLLHTHGEYYEREFDFELSRRTVSEKAREVKGEVYKLNDAQLKERMYRLFERRYDSADDMMKELREVKHVLLEKARPDMVAVQREMQSGLESGQSMQEYWEKECQRIWSWKMPPSRHYRERAGKMLLRMKSEDPEGYGTLLGSSPSQSDKSNNASEGTDVEPSSSGTDANT